MIALQIYALVGAEIGSWATLVLGLVFAIAGVARVLSGGETVGKVSRNLRATFLVGLALCVVFSVLFVAGGLSDGVFHDEDVVLLTVCWSVLALIWLASRFIPAYMRRRAANA